MFKVNSPNDISIRVDKAIVENSIQIADKTITSTDINNWNYMVTGNGTYPDIIECKTLTASDHVIIGSTILGYDRLRFYDVILTGEKINNYDKVVENHYKMFSGLGNKDNILSSNFIGMYNSSKTVSANSWDHGIVIDNGTIADTQIVRNSVLVGTNNSSGISTSSFNNCIFGQVNYITKTKESCIFGKDNKITSDVSDANYSIICGTNNTTTDSRAFIFGRDNDITGPRNNSYTTPSIIIGNNNDVPITKGKSILIGTDIRSSITHVDGFSNSIIIGNGTLPINPYTMHLGADEITDTYIHGISGSGDYLKIDADNRITRTTITIPETSTAKLYDPLYFCSTGQSSSFLFGNYGLVADGNFTIFLNSDFNIGNENFMLRFCVNKDDVPVGYRPKYTCKIEGNSYNAFTTTVNFVAETNGTVQNESTTETFYQYSILVEHNWNNSTTNFKDARFKLEREYSRDDGSDLGVAIAPLVVFI
jgi:hypothetical protein